MDTRGGASTARAEEAGPVERLRQTLAGAPRWANWLVALVLGLAAAAALPPVHAVPVLIVSFTGLVWLIGDAKPGSDAPRSPWRAFRAAAATGWWFGTGFFAAGLYWIVDPFLVEPRDFLWMIPFALVGMSGGLALFTALATGLARITARTDFTRAAMLAVWWIAFEWLRGWIFTGFPWNFIATAWMPVPAMLQIASVAGVFGLGFLTVFVAASPAALAMPVPARTRWMRVIAAFAVLGIVWGEGAARLAAAGHDTVAGVRLRLVQPNVDQNDKWKRALRGPNFERLLAFSRRPAAGAPPTLIIWPETAVTGFLAAQPNLIAAVASVAPPGGAVITGALRGRFDGNRLVQVWNSLYAVGVDGRILATYDKVHLVPFGEYVPFRAYLPIGKLTAGRVDFSPGPGLVALDVPGAPPFSPLICYEATFPGEVIPPGERVGWMLNITNDAWFGNFAGPYQHFASARLRAVEEGKAMVRAANTGISAVVDGYGRVVGSIGLGRTGVLDAGLPAPVAGGTIYARFGNWIVFAVMVLTAALANASIFRR